ncbi:hypothetical protein MICAE_1200009 [Microcystis aeruginosa PCC 9806]|uniref:Uncharacterized protein n=1 Tax=Microcystis aeruginosa PCC 9806 TaxID=1160282 RepID=I4GR21_MICAE|nr:hypothetical protein MICAE_1200009 [Microcystis aeruginosa PCC 9806]
MRSLTEAAGFILSSFTTMRAFTPSATGIRFSWTRGVLPTNWVMSLAIGIIPLALYLLATFDYICILNVLQYFLGRSTLQNAGVGTSDHNVGGDYPCRFFCLASFFGISKHNR